MAEQPGFGRDRLDRQDVQSGPGKYSTIECSKQIVGVHDCAARRVDDPGSPSHAIEELASHHAAGLRRERSMDADEIARGEQTDRIVYPFNIGRKVAVDEIRIACKHTLECIAREMG